MQAFFCDCVRRDEVGIAIAARRPMMATTIMISTSVKPDFGGCSVFHTCSMSFSFAGEPQKAG